MPPPASISTSSPPARARPRLEALVALWLLALALTLAAARAMPASSWWEPLLAQRTGQLPLVATRVIALAGALLALRAHKKRERALWAAALVLGVLASFASNAGALALVIVAVLSVARTRVAFAPRAPSLRGAAIHAAALAVGVVLGAALGRPPAPVAPPADVPAAARLWIARDNPHRALPLARAWAGAEQTPGEGALALAAVARRLGDEDDARRIAARVAAEGAPADQLLARAFLERRR